jgi:iron complex transport system permease protein
LNHSLKQRSSRFYWIATLLACLSIFLILAGIFVGSTGFLTISNALNDGTLNQIIWDVRLPRSFGAYLAGALLGLTGAIAQGLFRNPLADPYLLGSASGASFAVALSLMLLGGSPFANYWLVRVGLTGAAFMGATIAVLLTLFLSHGVQNALRLLLSGVVVGVIFGALSSIISLLSPNILQAMQAFLLGSTGFMGWNACIVMYLVLLVSLLISIMCSKTLDGLMLGEATAISLGLRLRLNRIILIGVISLATGAAVAEVGLVAFVGLVSPHLARSLIRTNHAKLIFLSTMMGGVILLSADVLARWIAAPQELPVGVLTALIGGGYLLWLMYRDQAIAPLT